VRAAIHDHNGYVFKTVGDAFCATFAHARDALTCAVAIQRAIAAETWSVDGGIAVRIGLHTGDDYEIREGDYFGRSVNRAARLGGIVHPRQIVLDAATFELARPAITANENVIDHGLHRLKDVDVALHIKEVRLIEERAPFPPLASLDRIDTNLPVPGRPIVGRSDSIERIANALAQSSVVTVLGTAGIGKTRLALEAAASLAERYPDGVRFVDFTRDPGSPVLSVIRSGLLSGDESVTFERLIDRVRERQQLVLVDDADDNLEEIALLITRLTEAAPGLRFLTTSRRPLPARGATAIRISRLAPGDAEAVLRDALRSHGIVGTDDALVARLAESADGIPLALEVIAGAAAGVPLDHLATTLDRELAAGHGTVEILTQTVKASVDVLAEAERRIFACAATFRGGWTIEAMQQLAGAIGISAADAIAALRTLVAAALVELDGSRYRMFAPIRAYASTLLDDTARSAVQRAHVEFYTAFAVRSVSQLPRAPQAQRRAILAERANLRLALRSSLEMQRTTEALTLSLAIVPIWQRAGEIDDGLGLLASVDEAIGAHLDDRSSAQLATALATMSQYAGRPESAAAHAERARADAERSGDEAIIADAELAAANVIRFAGDSSAAEQAYRQCAERFERLGREDGVARAHFNLAAIYESNEQFARAREYFESSLNHFELAGDDYRMASCLYGLASVAARQGETESARAWIGESLALRRELEDPRGIAECLFLEASLDATSDAAGTLERLEEALTLAERSGYRLGLAIGARIAAEALAALGRDEDAALVLGTASALARETALERLDPSDTTLARTETLLSERMDAAALLIAKRRGARERERLASRFRLMLRGDYEQTRRPETGTA
jgi:predicted ATPase